MKLSATRSGWLCLGLLLLSGCGGPERFGVEGSVTLDGKPLDAGTLRLIPMPGTKGPTAGGEIKGGKFQVDAAKGLFAGTYRVEITAGREPKNAQPVYDEMLGKSIIPWEQYLPARYNTESELRVEIVPGKNEPVEFALRMDG